MVKKSSIRFSCPRCENKSFRSLVDVKNHFINERHSFQCPVCERPFQDELGLIQHYQKYTKSASPGTLKDVHRLSSPSVTSPSAVAKPVVRSMAVQTDAPEEPSEPSEQGPEIPDVHLLHSLMASITAINFKEGCVLGKEFRIYPLSNLRHKLISFQQKLYRVLHLALQFIQQIYTLWSRISSCDIYVRGVIHGIVFRRKDISWVPDI
ncbi:Zinc finger, C2H2 [Penicillium italicum]|uniref:Zinc finger, C2H2 n=1 Tax=Penicillium italicum TaxID=40296 RepID=A0A0A2L3R1_PENIT|nr:Zinc finger, C2H2 [Penicillium italicum]